MSGRAESRREGVKNKGNITERWTEELKTFRVTNVYIEKDELV